MLSYFNHRHEPEKYSSFKKRKFNDYKEKMKKIIIGIKDVSLKENDKIRLLNELKELINEYL